MFEFKKSLNYASPELGLKSNQILISYSHKFCATIALDELVHLKTRHM